jgi:hypothetical protein
MYDETDSGRDGLFNGEVLPPQGRSLASRADFDPVERQLRLAMERAAKGLVIAAGCYVGYKLWKAAAERG